jgi:hypothetical protein
VISPSQGRYLNTGQHSHRISSYTNKTSIPWVGFEPTIPASERAKTVHALDRAATVTGIASTIVYLLSQVKSYNLTSNVAVNYLPFLPRFGELKGSNIVLKTGYHHWGSSWLFSVPPGKS